MGPNYTLYMSETLVKLGLSEKPPRVGPRSWCMSQLVGAHSLQWDAMPNLNAGERDLVLPQLNVPEF